MAVSDTTKINRTPMMLQYRSIKQQYKNEVLFFRMGDFYEMFDQDAREVSSLLDLTLTKRNGVPMCGIPYHAAPGYIARLLKAGRKVAVCEQTHLPPSGKGIAKREVVEVLTPGTVVDENLLDRNSNNYLAALGKWREFLSFSYIDLSTAEFFATSFSMEESLYKLRKELHRLSPREMIVQESLLEEDEQIRRLLQGKDNLVLNRLPDWMFDPGVASRELKNQFGVTTLKGFGLTDLSPEVISAGVVLDYIRNTAKRLLPHLDSIVRYQNSSFVELDESTQKNLELINNQQEGSKRYTLLEVLDFCRNAMGARRLRRWILTPLRKKKDIEIRLEMVEFLYRNQILLSTLRDLLGRILDLERLASKVAMDRSNAKDLLSIKISLMQLLEAYTLLKNYKEMASYTAKLHSDNSNISKLVDLLEKSIQEEPSILLSEGNLIKEGYHQELDNLRDLKNNAHAILKNLLEAERKSAGITSLKLKYNRVIGYFFEVTKSNLSQVPDYFIRRQSLVGGERFTTTRLSEIESDINNASEKIVDLERQLFLKIRDTTKNELDLLKRWAIIAAEIDVFSSFAFAATVHGYCKPVLTESNRLKIIEGRHPVVEANLPSGSFVPNNVILNEADGNFVLLTGPNMAGKSTFLRQVALIVLMAQIGSFVPAQEAEIGIVDSIYCRVGATDNLARGESTFLVEMNETAHILRSATDRSLLILDEVGRGTSTTDGLSIAWAVVRHILKNIQAKTLFATHFHELTDIEHSRMQKLTMDVIESSGEIVFLKRVKPGCSDNSYGLHVARLAGIPETVLQDAADILSSISDNPKPLPGRQNSSQPSLFDSEELIIKEIENIDIERTSPLEALNRLAEWKRQLKDQGPP